VSQIRCLVQRHTQCTLHWRVVSKLRSYKNRDTVYTTLLTFHWTAGTSLHSALNCPPPVSIIIAPMVAAAVDTYTQTIMSTTQSLTQSVSQSVSVPVYLFPTSPRLKMDRVGGRPPVQKQLEGDSSVSARWYHADACRFGQHAKLTNAAFHRMSAQLKTKQSQQQ
jgi:hypothetical protein